AARPPGCTLLPYTTLFRSLADSVAVPRAVGGLHPQQLVSGGGEVGVPVFVAGHVKTLSGVKVGVEGVPAPLVPPLDGPKLIPDIDRKSTRLNSSHVKTSYA